MHGPYLHANRLGETHADQQIFEHGALPRLDSEARCSQQIHVRLVFADAAGIIDTDHFIEVVENANMLHRRLSQHRRQRCGNGKFRSTLFQLSEIFTCIRFGFDHCGIHDAGHMIPLIHQLFGSVGKAETRNRIFGDLAELHGRDFRHVIVRHVNASF